MSRSFARSTRLRRRLCPRWESNSSMRTALWRRCSSSYKRSRGWRTTLTPNLRAAVGALLVSLGVSSVAVAREMAAMESVTFGRATGRRMLGSMNGLAFQASVCLVRGYDLLTLSRRLADTLLSAIGVKSEDYGYPKEVARELLTTSLN